MRNSRIVIPSLVQHDILDKIHCGHQGITKCRLRARQSVWRPGLSKQLEELVTSCPTCCKERSQHAEPLLPTQFPKLPWQKVASDLFTIKSVNYLLVIDYFSRYIEVAKLTQETSNAIIAHLKSIFARHGIPQELVTDNGPQYSSREFMQFAKRYSFKHQTSSPCFPQSNGEAERGVQTVKKLLKTSDDPYLALLSYRSTPLPNIGYSRAELLMNRKLRSNLPTKDNELQPKIPDYSKIKKSETTRRENQKENFDSRHKAHNLPPLKKGDMVRMPDHKCTGKVVSEVAPRSYTVQTSQGTLRRNRRQLVVSPTVSRDDIDIIPDIPTSNEPAIEQPTVIEQSLQPAVPSIPPANGTVRTRSGCTSRPPQRYRLDNS